MLNGQTVYLGLDVSTQTIGITVLIDDGSEYGKIVELTHISPKVSSKIKGIEQLFLKKKIFEEFITKYKDFGIDKVIIEEPLMKSNNISTCGVLLRFNGMISDCIYNILGVVPEYISSYDARKYSFPELMAIRKYGKDGKQYDYKKIMKEITDGKFVLFGSYSWEVDKKTVMQDKVSKLFPDIEWLYDKKGELKKENFDAVDSYVALLGWLNRKRYGELDMKVNNIVSSSTTSTTPTKIEYNVEYWDKREHRITYID
jgi:hypothetical protein